MGRDHPARPVAAQSPLCKAPLPLKIRAAQGCPLGVGTARNRTTRVSPAQSHGLGVPSCPQAPTSVQFQGGKTNGEGVEHRTSLSSWRMLPRKPVPGATEIWATVQQGSGHLTGRPRARGPVGARGFALDPSNFKEQV